MITDVLCWIVTAFWLVLLLHVIFSWVPRPPDPILPVVRGVRAVVEPLARPLRRVLPPLQLGGMALDLSILVLFLGVLLLQGVVCGVG